MSFRIIRKVATVTVHEYGVALELNRMVWGTRPEKWDLRFWGRNEFGECVPLRGISLTDKELDDLYRVLKEEKERKNDVCKD